jgi:Plasmid pRiA4b ORF-3-like protein/PBS lyase HEAT-like repeat
VTDITGNFGKIYRLTIDLVGSRPRIWRVVEVPGDVTLERLHDIVQAAMGWEDRHLWRFSAGGRRFEYPEIDDLGNSEHASRTLLWEIASKEGAQLQYSYDFGDGWTHDIRVESIDPPEPGVEYPRCIGGARACPPEDCGGIPGYESILAARENPNDPEWHHAMEWLGKGFNAAEFDMAWANVALRPMDPKDTPWWTPGMSAEDMENAPLERLLDLIMNWGGGVPVRAMERVIRMGDEALDQVGAALALWSGDHELETPWLAVILGEIGNAEAVDWLVHHMCIADNVFDAVAALEALARIGPEAIPALMEVVDNGSRPERLYAYGALGKISAERSFELLVDALERDEELTGVVGEALADQGRADAIPLLYSVLERCEPFHRLDLENAIADLHTGPTPRLIPEKDWRLRYQPYEPFGMFNVGWVGIAALTNEELRKIRDVSPVPVRPLDEILREAEELRAGELAPDFCDTCGEEFQKLAGLWGCPESFVVTAIMQLGFLEEARENGMEDLFDLMDEAQHILREIDEDQEYMLDGLDELDEFEGLDELDGLDEIDEDDEVADWEIDRARADLAIQTCRWLLGQGIESVSAAGAVFTDHVDSLVARYGDPGE